MTSNEKSLPLSLLRRYHFGELEGDEKVALETRLATDPEAKARLERIRTGEAAFLAGADVAAESVAILEQMDRKRPRPMDQILAFLRGRALQTAAALVLVVALVPIARLALEGEPGPNRTKGSAQLQMFVRDDDGVKEGMDGMTLSEGDQIQFRYRAVGHRYLFVVSVDAQGVVSPLYPDAPSASIPVRPDGLQTLEGSIILDESRGPERIFAVFSDEPMAYGAIAGALERSERDPRTLKKLDLGREDVEQATILIIKE